MGHKGFERRRRVDAWLPSAAELLRRRAAERAHDAERFAVLPGDIVRLVPFSTRELVPGQWYSLPAACDGPVSGSRDWEAGAMRWRPQYAFREMRSHP